MLGNYNWADKSFDPLNQKDEWSFGEKEYLTNTMKNEFLWFYFIWKIGRFFSIQKTCEVFHTTDKKQKQFCPYEEANLPS